jgi:hypothetical protein
VIDAILDYRPVVALNGLAVIGFVAGYALFGIAMTRTASLPGCPESSLPWAPPLTCSAPALRSSSHRPCGRSLFCESWGWSGLAGLSAVAGKGSQ